MKQWLVIGGLAAIAPQLYSDVTGLIFTSTQGAVSLPGYGTSSTWETWLALVGFIALLLGLFL